MTALHRFALQAVLLVAAIAAGWLWHLSEVSAARKGGYSAAVAAGEKQRAIDAAAALTTERTLRAKLAARDAADIQKEQTHAETLAAAQRRMRAGDDSLRIAIKTIRATAAPADRPAAGGPAPDGPGESIVPAVAADILGLAADSGRLVRKYERLEARFDECRALNNGPAANENLSN